MKRMRAKSIKLIHTQVTQSRPSPPPPAHVWLHVHMGLLPAGVIAPVSIEFTTQALLFNDQQSIEDTSLSPFSTRRICSRDAKRKQEFSNVIGWRKSSLLRQPITLPDSCFRFASREQIRLVENGLYIPKSSVKTLLVHKKILM